MKIDLILIGRKSTETTKWSLGQALSVNRSVAEIFSLVESQVSRTDAEYLFFWGGGLKFPAEELIKRAVSLPGDLWHCGLNLSAGTFKLFDLVKPAWMLNLDAEKNIGSSSYKLSLGACIIKKEVIRQLGFIDPRFDTLEAASLELGYRYMAYGVFVKYEPRLADELNSKNISFSFYDEMLFIHLHFKRKWKKWVLFRSIVREHVSLLEAVNAHRKVKKIKKAKYLPFKRDGAKENFDINRWKGKISAIIPTLKRYPYLKKLLQQLNMQTLKPQEVIVIDQTPANLREGIDQEFDFILKVFYQQQPGQCSSRNYALSEAQSEYILFLDDDVEIGDDLIEKHAKAIERFRADSSSGVALEPGMDSLPFNFTYTRVSDVFPTNNTLIKREILDKAGSFDLAFEKGKRADHDLGIRVYLSGAFMVLNPEIKIIHQRAAKGGLREYGQRRITRYLSKSKVNIFDLPSYSEIHLWLKHFGEEKAREAFFIKLAGNANLPGSLFRKLLRVLWFGVNFPYLYISSRGNYRRAARLFRRYREKKIMVISSEFPPGPGGIGTNSYYLSYWLQEFGYKVSVVTPQNYARKKEIQKFNEKQNFKITTLRHLSFSFLEAISRFFTLSKQIILFNPTAIIASGKHSVMLAAILKRIFSLPLLAVVHANEFLENKKLVRFFYQQADKIIAVSKWTSRLVEASGLDSRKIKVIHNGGDEKLFRPNLDTSCLREEHKLTGKKIILTVGNVTLRKAQDTVIRAMPLILKQYSNTVYMMVGLPTEKDKFLKLAQELAVENKVIFLGPVKTRDLPYYYNLCDIFILPSRVLPKESAEGYGIVVIEAAFCAKAAIVAKGAGLEETVEDGKTGVVVANESPRAIAQAVLRIFSDQEFSQKLNEETYKKALKDCAWKQKISLYRKVVEEMMIKAQ